jgi:signal transduction histidine kinase
VCALADRRHVDQILDNLITNALAYAGRPAQIEVSLVNAGRPGIAVSDWGPGIAPERRDRIFDRFFRGSETAPGSGLGLYVSRQLALVNRGTLELDAGWEHGSRFVLRLPRPRRSGEAGHPFGHRAVQEPEQRAFDRANSRRRH